MDFVFVGASTTRSTFWAALLARGAALAGGLFGLPLVFLDTAVFDFDVDLLGMFRVHPPWPRATCTRGGLNLRALYINANAPTTRAGCKFPAI